MTSWVAPIEVVHQQLINLQRDISRGKPNKNQVITKKPFQLHALLLCLSYVNALLPFLYQIISTGAIIRSRTKLPIKRKGGQMATIGTPG